MTLPSHVRFPSGVISWTRSSLRKLDILWMNAYKMACGVSNSTSSCILRYPTALVSRNLPPPLTVVCETVWNHLESCCFELGGLRELLFMENKEALHSRNCNDLEELQRGIALSNLQWHQATQNRFVYACFLAHILQNTLVWEPFPQDSIWCTSSVQLAHLLKDFAPTSSSPGTFPPKDSCAPAYKKSQTRPSYRIPQGP